MLEAQDGRIAQGPTGLQEHPRIEIDDAGRHLHLPRGYILPLHDARLRTHMCRSLLLPIWIRAGIQSDQQEGIHAHIPSEKSSGPSAAILDRHDFMRRDDRHRIPVLRHSS